MQIEYDDDNDLESKATRSLFYEQLNRPRVGVTDKTTVNNGEQVWRHRGDHFYHIHGPVQLRQAPTASKSASRRPFFVNKSGIDIEYQQGNSVAVVKDVHARYCDHFMRHRCSSGVIFHSDLYKIHFEKSMRVIARWDPSGYYFTGKITDIVDEEHANVLFDNGHEQNDLSFRHIIKKPRRAHSYQIGDFVMANVSNEYEQSIWLPGRISGVRWPVESDESVRYSILYCNDQGGVNSAAQLVRIGKRRFEAICDDLRCFLKEKTRAEEAHVYAIEAAKLEQRSRFYRFSNDDAYRRLVASYRPLLQPPLDICLPTALTTASFKRLRDDYAPLSVDDQVLAKWPNDNYYYSCVIKCALPNNQYRVENICKEEVKDIYREDILHESRNFATTDYTVGDTVIARHPTFPFAHCPGEVVEYERERHKLKVRLYDYSECFLNMVGGGGRDQVFRLSRAKFEHDVQCILSLENHWVGHTVLALHHETKSYEWGKIVSALRLNRQFGIQWTDTTVTIQNAYNIFTHKSSMINK